MKKRRNDAAILAALLCAWLIFFLALLMQTTAQSFDIPVSRQVTAILTCGDLAETAEIRDALGVSE